MEKILKRYNESFFVNVNHPKSAVIDFIIQEKSKKKDIFEFFSNNHLDFRELTVIEDVILIDLKPKIFNPFRGSGRIYMKLNNDVAISGTLIMGEIIPYDEQYKFTVYIVIVFILLWSVLVFMTTSGINTLIMLSFSLGILPMILILIPFWYRRKLRIYRDFFLDFLAKNDFL
jgi:hypothetical protein